MVLDPTRNLGMELVRVTEAAALSAGRYMGRGDKNAADHAAVEAMRIVLHTIEMNAVIVIGEGEKDHAPMLFNGEHVGTGEGIEMDIAVDPIDGTRPLANGSSNALAIVAMSPRGTMFDPGPYLYMNKIAVGPLVKGKVDIDAPVEVNLAAVARAGGKAIEDVTVVILDRPRHEQLIADVRRTGARIRLITDGDVAGALMTSWPETGIDILMGIGGTPEGVLTACALRAMGGEIQGRLVARNEDEHRRGEASGYNFDKVLYLNDLVSSDDVYFAATGITDGVFLDGVKYTGSGARTDSLVVRGLTGTVRQIVANHRWEKLNRFSAIKY